MRQLPSKMKNQVNIADSINSGQVFLWERQDDTWFGINGQDVLEIGEQFDAGSCDAAQKEFLRLGDRYDQMLKEMAVDGTIRQGIKKYYGMRLLRQDPFQCYISFIVATNSNIQNIRASLRKICRKFGKNSGKHRLFPNPKKLARASLAELQSCGLGYRAKFVKQASQKIVDDEINLNMLKTLDYNTAKSALIQVPGIGGKVADCIMLFSLEKLDAFPLDTWMIKALQEFYSKRFPVTGKSLTEKKYNTLHNEVVDYFGRYAGFSQQFLFKMIRDQNKKKWF